MSAEIAAGFWQDFGAVGKCVRVGESAGEWVSECHAVVDLEAGRTLR